MKLSEKTLIILKNFSKISNSVFFYAGKEQKTMSTSRSIVVESIIDEEFPQDFGIYDLAKFLSLYSFFSAPELTFNKDYVTLSEGDSKANFWFSSKSMIKNIPPEGKSLSMKSVDAAFELSSENLNFLYKAQAILSLPHFIIEGNGKNINLIVRDSEEQSSNQMSKTIAETTEEFKFVGDVDNLKMIDDAYDVQLSKGGLIKFSSKNLALKYWVAIKKNA